MDRLPIVSGSFYPGIEEELVDSIKTYMGLSAGSAKTAVDGTGNRNILGAMSPHAGYVYSGRVMGSVFSRIDVPDTVVVLAPNHTGRGSPFSVWPDGCWITPLGETSVDEELVDEILSSCELFEKDRAAHINEHSAEVILPFLQFNNPGVRIVVIVIMSDDFEDLRMIGRSIGSVLNATRPDALVVASSDMTHYESRQTAGRKDKSAIAEIVALREEGLYRVARELNVTMCGINPVISMMVCSKERAATKAELTMYETSGDVTGDYDRVVGYAGVIIE